MASLFFPKSFVNPNSRGGIVESTKMFLLPADFALTAYEVILILRFSFSQYNFEFRFLRFSRDFVEPVLFLSFIMVPKL